MAQGYNIVSPQAQATLQGLSWLDEDRTRRIMQQGGFDGDKNLPQPSGSTASQSSSTYFANPEQAARLANLTEGLAGQAGSAYMNFVNDPTSSPIYQNSLQGVLKSLEPAYEKQQQDATDAFRMAGQRGAGSYGTYMAKLAGENQRNQIIGASDVLSKIFPQVTSALQAPLNNVVPLVNASKLQQSQGQSESRGDPSEAGIPYSIGNLKWLGA